MNKDDRKLWDLLIASDSYLIQEFSLAVIGIGALFFAYNEVSPPMKELVSAFGLGASLTLWMSIYATSKDTHHMRDELSGTMISDRHRRFRSWRWRKNGSFIRFFLFQPVSRMITYLMALITMIWFEVLVYNILVQNYNDTNFPELMMALRYFGYIGFAVVLGFGIGRKCEDWNKECNIRTVIERNGELMANPNPNPERERQRLRAKRRIVCIEIVFGIFFIAMGVTFGVASYLVRYLVDVWLFGLSTSFAVAALGLTLLADGAWKYIEITP